MRSDADIQRDVTEELKWNREIDARVAINRLDGQSRDMSPEEIARRFPRITVIGAHCGNPEYEWAAEIRGRLLFRSRH